MIQLHGAIDPNNTAPCTECGTETALIVNGFAYCPKHIEGLAEVAALEALRVGAPPDVAEEAGFWLIHAVRHSIANMQ